MIIINGVDVSECLEFDKHDNTTCKLATLKNGYPVKCSCCWNCYFKCMKREQGARKELEKRNEHLNTLRKILLKTDVYINVCEDCKEDEIRKGAKYKDVDVDRITLYTLLQQNEYFKKECDELKIKLTYYIEKQKQLLDDLELSNTQIRSFCIGEEKICNDIKKYKSALEEIEKCITFFNAKEAFDIKDKIYLIIKEVLHGSD